ncbi:hypothetical protein B0H14DRAFT_3664938 [Mycena olivaceomarginata]|nr:hypothetical protein B0H14DRAFT_3664938 [Mycena olivaceomarginata]
MALGVLSSRKILNNIPGPRSLSLWTGNLKELFNVTSWDFHHELGEKYWVQEKQLYIFDPKSLHQLLIKPLHPEAPPCTELQASVRCLAYPLEAALSFCSHYTPFFDTLFLLHLRPCLPPHPDNLPAALANLSSFDWSMPSALADILLALLAPNTIFPSVWQGHCHFLMTILAVSLPGSPPVSPPNASATTSMTLVLRHLLLLAFTHWDFRVGGNCGP